MIVERRVPALLVALTIAFIAVFAAHSAHAQRRPRNDVFAVTVPVDATAATAAAARDAARVDGQRRAFRQLVERLAAPGDAARLPRIGDAALTDMVQDIEVANERSSAVRYLADYTYRFRPDAVRRVLRQANIAFAETPSKPVVVVPVLRRGDSGAAVLWDDPNPWRHAWAARKPGGLVPVIVPDGDLGDVTAIDADQALTANPEALNAVAAKYGGGDVLVAIATAPAGDPGAPLQQVELSGGRYADGKLTVPISGSVRANPDETEPAFLARAVAATMHPVEEAWKKETLIRSGEQGTLDVSVPVAGMEDWVAVRDRLAGLPAIRQAELLSLTRQEARLELHYLGDPSQLKLALAQRDLVLTEGQPLWTLTRRPTSAGR